MNRDESGRPPGRPPRLRYLFTGVRPFYFVTFNTWNRAPVLNTPTVHNDFRSFCERGQDYGIAVGRYVIMPDHIHLFVVFPETGLTIARWVQSMKSVLGKSLLSLGVNKPHWQRGFFDHVLRSAESYSEKWEYVRNNPVRKGLCPRQIDWPFQGEIVDLRF